MTAPRLFLVLTLLALSATREARGNGRFPKAQLIATVPSGDGQSLFLRTTFGVLLSRDGGKTWMWLCEQAFGTVSTWDPPLIVTRDGRLWLGLTDGMRVTRDGCEVRDVPAFTGETVVDFAADANGRLFAATSTQGKAAQVWRQTEGDAWARRGKIEGVRIDTIEVAPARPTRLYATAVDDGNKSHFYRSDDAGATFTLVAPKLPHEGRVFVAAVDPKDPERVLVRALHDAGSDLLVSTDGGKTVRLVLSMKGAMFGFARSEDGQSVWAGSGDPMEGIWLSLDRGDKWEPGAKGSVFCLHADGPRLYACSNPYVQGGYAVAMSSDGGRTLREVATFEDISGPVACDAGTGQRCEAAWPETHAAVAASARIEPAVPSASPAPAPPRTSSSSAPRACGCQEAGASAFQAGWGAIALLLAAWWRRRRDRTPLPHHP